MITELITILMSQMITLWYLIVVELFSLSYEMGNLMAWEVNIIVYLYGFRFQILLVLLN